MGMFLPESTPQAAPTTVAINEAAADPTSEDMALMQRVFAAASKSPTQIPDGFLSYVFDWLQTQRLEIPIGQVFGFSAFTANFAPFVSGASTRSSSAFGNLPDGLGPGFGSSGFGDPLPNGSYLCLWGCLAAGNPGVAQAQMKLLANGATLTTNNCGTSVANLTSVMCADILTLTNTDNTLFAQYASSDNASTATFSQRWIIALKFANH